MVKDSKKKKPYKKKSNWLAIRAKEQITSIFKMADEIYQKFPHLADRYVKIARQLAMKVRLKMPREFKRKYCKFCKCFLVPSKNCRVRLHNGHLVYYCLNCKKITRIGYANKK